MKSNMGKLDRGIRAVLGVIFVLAGYFYGLWWLYVLAAIMLITSAAGFCPLYMPFKFTTLKKK